MCRYGRGDMPSAVDPSHCLEHPIRDGEADGVDRLFGEKIPVAPPVAVGVRVLDFVDFYRENGVALGRARLGSCVGWYELGRRGDNGHSSGQQGQPRRRYPVASRDVPCDREHHRPERR
jgi:hypothetical protein